MESETSSFFRTTTQRRIFVHSMHTRTCTTCVGTTIFRKSPSRPKRLIAPLFPSESFAATQIFVISGESFFRIDLDQNSQMRFSMIWFFYLFEESTYRLLPSCFGIVKASPCQSSQKNKLSDSVSASRSIFARSLRDDQSSCRIHSQPPLL